MVTRDYVSVKLWDLRMADRPMSSMKVADFIEPKLCDLYES